MKHIFIPKEGDRERFLDHVRHFKELSDLKLIEAYHKEANIGITGVHAQAVYMLALRKVIKERFGDSPISLGEGGIIGI